MKIGLIDIDSHHFPNLALMKLSAHHKRRGDKVDWWNGLEQYDLVYMSKVFTEEYSPDLDTPVRADRVIRGGTGYGLDNALPEPMEHTCPDYGLYPQYRNTAYGFLTRGCPRNCPFFIVTAKEGRISRPVADLEEFWRGQPVIKLLDPNLLACWKRDKLLQQLIQTKAWVDFTQGLDIRLADRDVIALLDQLKMMKLRFAWDDPREDLAPAFVRYAAVTAKKKRKVGVYVLTNFNSSFEEDLHRVTILRSLGFDPFVMLYNKPEASTRHRRFARWVNNKYVFRSVPDFKDYDSRI